MASTEAYEQYCTHEARLASFQKSTKKRGSTAGGRGKSLTWPHKQISPESLARAGFFFNPGPDNVDNVTCFLCEKALDGWEAGDDPLREHLKHAPHCGWAVVAAIDAELEEYITEDPTLPYLVEARKSTFAGRWPHDGKRGWKCKTKQLVEAGWSYNPSPESDDMATCAYCQLSLDGWEQNDKPYDEHFSRAPECPFFKLGGTKSAPAASKKTGRAKAARGSKASRLSTQSVATLTSEAPSMLDSIMESTPGIEDSVLTTASTATQAGKKSKAKKAPAAKGRKTKAKKAEPAESVESEEAEILHDEMIEPIVEPVEHVVTSPPKPAKAKKRGSDAIDESTLTLAEAPAAKRRATKTSKTTEDSVLEAEDVDVSQVSTAKVPRGSKGRTPSGQSSRKPSATSNLSASMASARAPSEFLDDDAIERQLQEELDRQLTDDEIAMDSDSERSRDEAKKANASHESLPGKRNSNYAMYDPTPARSDDAAIEAELDVLRKEMEEVPEEPLHIPKKGRKAAPRKASKQTKTKKAKAESPSPKEDEVMLEAVPVVDPPAPELEAAPAAAEDANVSVDSTETVVKNDLSRTSSEGSFRARQSEVSVASQDELQANDVAEPVDAPAKRRRGRPSKASLASRESVGPAPAPVPAPAPAPAPATASDAPPAKRGRGRPPKQSHDSRASIEPRLPPKMSRAHEDEQEDELLGDVKATSPPIAPVVPLPTVPGQSLEQGSLTPSKATSPVTSLSSLKRAILSPSPSPQSSDAENQPPSSKPTASASTKRIALAPLVATPTQGSPSKRNVLAGLKSSTPWTTADIEAILGTPRSTADKENAAQRLVRQGWELSSPEKKMTVEEWIYFNAGESERKLKQECEAMVSRFEMEGTRAMRVLEGLETE